MRLTLRTMLAYLDDVLEPADAEEIRKKIEESEYASGLVHRIRNATRKIRLPAPALTGKGLDPNTVAEYLDNVLPQKRVPDFEKVCLEPESDAHLAEVAACHQILTLVLGEPADVNREVRERIYRVGVFQAEVESELDAAAAPRTTFSGPEKPLPQAKPLPASQHSEKGSADKPTRPHAQEVPEYLRAGEKSKFRRFAVIAGSAFAIMLVALLAIGPNTFRKMLGMNTEVAVTEDLAAAPDQPETNATETDAAAPAEPAATAPDTRPGESETAVPANTAIPENPAVAAEPASEPAPPAPEVPLVGNPADAANPLPAAPASGDVALAAPGNATNNTATAPTPDVPEAENGLPAAENGLTAAESNGEPATPAEVPATEPPPAPAATPVLMDVGRFSSENEVLLRHVPANGTWQRIATRDVLTSQDHLLNLPPCQGQILLTPGLQLYFVGATSAHMAPRQGQDTPSMKLDYGRAVVLPIGVANARLHLQAGRRAGTLQFRDENSAVAIEVSRFLPPGVNPVQASAETVIQVFCTSGQCQWTEDSADPTVPVVVNAGEVQVLLESQPDQRVPGIVLPKWISARDVDPIDQDAWDRLAPMITTQRDVQLSLLEQTENKSADVRSLAVRCLSQLDFFDSFFDENSVLTDVLQRASWSAHFDALRQAIARSPESAERVQIACQKYRGEDAADLFQLIVGYSPEQLNSGGAAALVDFLDHDSIDIRILAFENLQRITGKSLGYRPSTTESLRKRFVREWRNRLEAGEVVYTKLPTPMPTYERLAAPAAPVPLP